MIQNRRAFLSTLFAAPVAAAISVPAWRQISDEREFREFEQHYLAPAVAAIMAKMEADIIRWNQEAWNLTPTR